MDKAGRLWIWKGRRSGSGMAYCSPVKLCKVHFNYNAELVATSDIPGFVAYSSFHVAKLNQLSAATFLFKKNISQAGVVAQW